MTLEELERRVRVQEDIEAIKQLQIRYVNCVTFAEYDNIGDFFAEDCSANIGPEGWIQGKAAVVKYFQENIARKHVGVEGLYVVHPLVTVDGDRAKGNWLLYMMFAHPRTWVSLFWAQGTYDCEYVREQDEWKFSVLKFNPRLGGQAMMEREQREA